MPPRPARAIWTGTSHLLGWQVNPRDGALGMKTHEVERRMRGGLKIGKMAEGQRVPLHLQPNVREGDTPRLKGRPRRGWWL